MFSNICEYTWNSFWVALVRVCVCVCVFMCILIDKNLSIRFIVCGLVCMLKLYLFFVKTIRFVLCISLGENTYIEKLDTYLYCIYI